MQCESSHSTYRGLGQSRPADHHSLASKSLLLYNDKATEKGRPENYAGNTPDTDVGNFTT